MNEENPFAKQVKEILMKSGNCAQTSFVVLQEQFDLDGGQILRALTPFPGIALRGETCGAVTGSLMALGLEFGRDDLSDWRGYIGSLPSARRFCKRFEEENGSTGCAKRINLVGTMIWPIKLMHLNMPRLVGQRHVVTWLLVQS
jgi:C_GCAxxG_C_C family probable redox protein